MLTSTSKWFCIWDVGHRVNDIEHSAKDRQLTEYAIKQPYLKANQAAVGVCMFRSV